MPEVELELKIAVHYERSNDNSKGKTRFFLSPFNAKYKNSFSYSEQGSSLLRVRLVPVPPPAILQDYMETLIEKMSKRVEDWAELMGYKCPKKFARRFLRYYSVRLIRMLEYIRLKSITRQLRKSDISNFEIARPHGISDQIALNKFINYHVDCSTTEIEIKRMSDEQFRERFEKFGSKIR